MKISPGSIKKKSYTVIWILIFIVITILCIILSLLVNPFWWILSPISLFFIFVFQLMSRYFWLEKNNCPRCNAPIGKYSEFCRNCGIKLWFKCISCGTYLRADMKFCDKCNIELKHTIEEKEAFQYKRIEEGETLPEIPNFCPNCGKEVKSESSIQFCEECGEKFY
ncbi:MAG: zinc ribbon domain-containing protein [Promethearchaeota archaeon]